jgi:nucleotidyltransferase AbiEii toxin of type IV toxin-antitoxin system
MIPYKDVFQALDVAKVRYLVAGGIALNLHQVLRATVDLDLIVQLDQENAAAFVKVMSALGYVPRVPVKAEDFADARKRTEWINEKNMMVFSFINPGNPMEIIDVFVREPIPFEEAYRRRKEVEAFGAKIPVLAIEDLIVLKELAGRPKDLYDVAQLKALKAKPK